jgi:hypothetical protein
MLGSGIFLLFSLPLVFCGDPRNSRSAFDSQRNLLTEKINDLRDSISAEIEMRTSARPVIYIFSSQIAHALLPHLQLLLHLRNDAISPCYNLTLIRPEIELEQFVSHHIDGALVLFTGLESLNGINITKLNFLHAVTDSVSSYGNLILILIWDSVLRPFPSSTDELYSFLQSHGGTTTPIILNSRALIGRITRLEGGGEREGKDEENVIPFICHRNREKSGWSMLYFIVTLMAIVGTVAFHLSPKSSTSVTQGQPSKRSDNTPSMRESSKDKLVTPEIQSSSTCDSDETNQEIARVKSLEREKGNSKERPSRRGENQKNYVA